MGVVAQNWRVSRHQFEEEIWCVGEEKGGKRIRNWTIRGSEDREGGLSCFVESAEMERANDRLEAHLHAGRGDLENQQQSRAMGTERILAADGSIRGGGPDLPLDPTREKTFDFGGGGGGADVAVAWVSLTHMQFDQD